MFLNQGVLKMHDKINKTLVDIAAGNSAIIASNVDMIAKNAVMTVSLTAEIAKLKQEQVALDALLDSLGL